jgi:hypothetical protein
MNAPEIRKLIREWVEVRDDLVELARRAARGLSRREREAVLMLSAEYWSLEVDLAAALRARGRPVALDGRTYQSNPDGTRVVVTDASTGLPVPHETRFVLSIRREGHRRPLARAAFSDN